MSTSCLDKPQPYPIRRNGNAWEVEFGNGEHRRPVECPTHKTATALANFPVFQHMWEYPRVYSELCSVEDLAETISAYDETVHFTCGGRRQLQRFADKLCAVA